MAKDKPAVLITGAARRIGATLARAFAAQGWHVVIHHGFSHKAAEALAAELPSAEVVQCDLADGDAAEAMVEAIAARLPDWRVLVNNAAVFNEDGAERIDPAVFAEAMAVNAAAPARMAQAFLRSARSAGGRRVIQFTDMKVENPNPDFFSYTMAKNALAASVRTLAMAQASPADRVYGLAPGAMLPSHDQVDEEHELSGRMNLLRRLTDPQELADAALFLAEGWLASGESLFIDSGQHLLSQPRDVLYLARGLS
ncbi:SDR family oxidoreductase [Novosphingobium sp. TH158]|uniref:SDR family oxidoreductase n=1 Tax=Novosphingobium sp. TH158 TaxID=2067455 RepID=UPI000C7B1356|nr:SDR family oxidoreductase [Novosphingobium sp. TH158]PLK26425.1 oxidoreductase [Novosphingobium sp. TH158]